MQTPKKVTLYRVTSETIMVTDSDSVNIQHRHLGPMRQQVDDAYEVAHFEDRSHRVEHVPIRKQYLARSRGFSPEYEPKYIAIDDEAAAVLGIEIYKNQALHNEIATMSVTAQIAKGQIDKYEEKIAELRSRTWFGLLIKTITGNK
jgi:hypothetical protein